MVTVSILDTEALCLLPVSEADDLTPTAPVLVDSENFQQKLIVRHISLELCVTNIQMETNERTLNPCYRLQLGSYTILVHNVGKTKIRA